MTVSARLRREVEVKLTRLCRRRGISKTEAIERGLELLLEQDHEESHPAYTAYRQLKLVAEPSTRHQKKRSSDPMRDAIRAKYSD
ncbi:MAG: hypothetical protein ACKVQU_02955 [Burkholderiales bacterium]